MNLKLTGMRTFLLAMAFTSLFSFFNKDAKAQYTSTYDGKSYSSTRPYNLNVVYFVPNDVPLDPTYKKRLSALMLWGQNFYRQGMMMSGYGDRTFGLFTETTAPDSVKIIRINGLHPSTSYTYQNPTQLETEVNTYFVNHPEQKGSDHILILTAVHNIDSTHAPFYGMAPLCFALDYPQFNLQYMGQTGYWGDEFTKWFGGMMHELGHGLNLLHSHETTTEHFNPIMGTNIMGIGNGTLGHSPTFVNHAGCAVLNNCQVFADTPGITYYNGHHAELTTFNKKYSNGNLIVSGKFTSNRTVTAINVYQDPHPFAAGGSYYRVAWSVPPIDADSFYVNMPVSEITGMGGIYERYHLEDTTRLYHLEVELVFKNGEKEFVKNLKFNYDDGIPVFDDVLSVEDVSVQNAVRLFPNPVKDELNISVSGGQKISSIAVFDLYGSRIRSQKSPSAILNMSGISPGIYMVEIQLKSGEAIRKKVSKL